MQGFKDFLMRGNLVELAVAFIMGAAFGEVVKTFTKVVLGFISKVLGGEPNFDAVTLAGVPVGAFLTAVVSFVIVAAVVYFIIVKPVNAWRERTQVPAEEGDSELSLLAEIRDLLSTEGKTLA